MSMREKCLLVSNAIIKHKQNTEGLNVGKDLQLLTFRLMNLNEEITKITPEGEINHRIAHLLDSILQMLIDIQQFQEKNFLHDGLFSSAKRSFYDDSLSTEVELFGKRIGSYITALHREHEDNPNSGYFYDILPENTLQEYQEKSYTLFIIYNDNVMDHMYTAEIRITASLYDLIRDLKEILLQVPQTAEVELLNANKHPMQDLPDQSLISYFQEGNLSNQVTIRRKITKMRAAGYLAMASLAVISAPIAVTALAVSYGVEKLVEKNSLLNDDKKAVISITRV